MGVIKITFTGDIMCKKEFLSMMHDGKSYCFDDMLSETASILNESDYVVGNLETPLAGEEKGYTSASFSFNSPIEFGISVKKAGVDMVSTANNHCLDRGIDGLIQTNESLDQCGIDHIGTRNSQEDPKSKIVNVGRLKIGMMAYTYGTEAASNKVWLNKDELYHVNLSQNQELHCRLWRKMWLSKYRIFRIGYRLIAMIMGQKHYGRPSDRKEKDVKQRKEIRKEVEVLRKNGAQCIAMSFHAGGQYNALPEKRVVKYAKEMRAFGIDMIIINHEHRVQEADFSDLKKGNITAFCLGNFLGGAGVYYPPYDKYAPYSVLLHVYIDEDTLDKKCGFTICKTIRKGNGLYATVLVNDLYESMPEGKDKDQLAADNLIIYNTFLKKSETHIPMEREYSCC